MVRSAWNLARPLLLVPMAYAGLYLTIAQLRSAPLHVNTIVWVLGILIAGSAVLDLVAEVRNRVLVSRWLKLEEPAKAAMQRPQVEKAMLKLTPWFHRRVAAKMRWLKGNEPRPDPYEQMVPPPDLVIVRRTPTLAWKLKNSALFVLCFLLLIPVGAFSFFVWLQEVLAGTPVSPIATALWLVSGAFYAFSAVAFLRERRSVEGPPM